MSTDDTRIATYQSARARLDSIVRASHTPGLQFVVVNAEGSLFEYVGGWSDLARRHPMNSGTTMMAYSMSKTFTAAAVGPIPGNRLGPISGNHVGPTPGNWVGPIRGNRAPIPLAWIHSPDAHETFDEHAALARLLRRHKRLLFAPGTRYGYSNIGYWLLGEFLQRVTGVAFTAYVAQRVLQPLGLTPQELGYKILGPPEHARGYLEKYSLMNLFSKREAEAHGWAFWDGSQ